MMNPSSYYKHMLRKGDDNVRRLIAFCLGYCISAIVHEIFADAVEDASLSGQLIMHRLADERIILRGW